MLKENLLLLSQELQPEEIQGMMDFSNESKVAYSVFSAGANILLAWFVSRQMEGTLNNRLEKGFVIAGCAGITAANAIVNHQIWT